MNVLYPMKFKPIYKDKIWGGQKIKTILNQDYGAMPNCGEAWLLSGIWNEQSVVTNGDFAGDEINDLVETFMGDLVGEKVFDLYGEQFPLLIKVIDANDWLSVQVHPDDELARKRGFENGKTEMWYVMQADKDAKLVMGLNHVIDKERYINTLKTNNIERYLNMVDVEQGDVFYIPAGMIHALGPGMMVAEIQQTSDITYRIYDWDRIDVAGMKRQLHIPESVDAIDFSQVDCKKTDYDTNVQNATVPVINSPYFVTNCLQLQGQMMKDYSPIDSFVILFCVEGKFMLQWENGSIFVDKGECILLPNSLNKVNIIAAEPCKLLEVYCDIAGEE